MFAYAVYVLISNICTVYLVIKVKSKVHHVMMTKSNDQFVWSLDSIH